MNDLEKLVELAIDERDYKKASDILRILGDKGDGSAYRRLGFLYFKGLGVEKDLAIALYYFRRAYELHDYEGAYNYGYCALHGIGMNIDYKEAKEALAYAAHFGQHEEALRLYKSIFEQEKVSE